MENTDYHPNDMKVLMVDDNIANLAVLSDILKEENFEISAATSGEMALKIVKRFLPDLILLDIMMPGINGYETCEKLKSDPETSDIPVIFLSAKVETDDIVKGFQVGGVDYITKPYYQKEVLIRIKTQLQLRNKSKKLEVAEAEIRQYSEDLAMSNQNLQDFAFIASHDLKAPLRKINYLGQFLKESCGDLLNDDGRNHISQIEKITDQLAQLIDSLLDYSTIAKNPKPFTPINLNSGIKEVLYALEAPIKETEGVIHVGELPTVTGEPFLIFRLFQNLISNALKFHNPGKSPVVNIHSQPTDNEFWKVLVEDNGIGFDEKYSEKVFQPFKRLVSADEFEGCGIGLAVCKRIVDHHNGTIECKSQPGKGTTFILTLPK
jgi:two-component system, sensor histidine kinase and response regulator